MAATDPSGEKPIMGFSAASVKNADAVKDKARALRDMLRKDPTLLQSASTSIDDKEAPESVPKKTDSPSILLSKSQVWKNKEGTEITAAVQKVEAGKVYFVMANGKVIPYPVANLSDDTINQLRSLMKGS